MSDIDELPDHLGPRADSAAAKEMVDALDADAMKGLLDKMAALRAEALARGADGEDAETKSAMAQEMFETMRLAMQKGGGAAGPDARRIAVVFACALVVFLLLAFFGYKLYRSLVDKERKREEKKKLKQQKKRK